MKIQQVVIGEHLVQVQFDSLLFFEFFKKNFKCIEKLNSVPDITIIIQSGYGEPFINYDVEVTNHKNKISFRRADYTILVDKQFKSAIISVYDELSLKHALMNLYSSFIVHHNWGLLLHSSCAVQNDKAHIFTGHSGAGKSTVAKLSYPRDLLSDEATPVKITSEGIIVYQSPFRSELESDCSDKSVALSSIQILYQALQNKRVKLGKSDALLHLIDKVFFWPHSQEETKTIMKLLTLLVTKVPVYELYFQKNNSFWELIS